MVGWSRTVGVIQIAITRFKILRDSSKTPISLCWNSSDGGSGWNRSKWFHSMSIAYFSPIHGHWYANWSVLLCVRNLKPAFSHFLNANENGWVSRLIMDKSNWIINVKRMRIWSGTVIPPHVANRSFRHITPKPHPRARQIEPMYNEIGLSILIFTNWFDSYVCYSDHRDNTWGCLWQYYPRVSMWWSWAHGKPSNCSMGGFFIYR